MGKPTRSEVSEEGRELWVVESKDSEDGWCAWLPFTQELSAKLSLARRSKDNPRFILRVVKYVPAADVGWQE